MRWHLDDRIDMAWVDAVLVAAFVRKLLLFFLRAVFCLISKAVHRPNPTFKKAPCVPAWA